MSKTEKIVLSVFILTALVGLPSMFFYMYIKECTETRGFPKSTCQDQAFQDIKRLFNQTKQTSQEQQSQEQQSQAQQDKWYEGGTLHNVSAIEWQQASYENKLATCADFISSMWIEKLLKPSLQNQIKTMDDMQVLAQELVTQMDAAMKESTDSEENRVLYTNQKVSDIASLLMISMGWVK